MNENHQESQRLAASAAELMAAGERAKAQEAYARAGKLELQAFRATPSNKQRTRSVLAVSLVSLYYKAADYDRAEHFIFEHLASRELNPWAESQLRELLEVVTDERIVQEHLQQRYSGEAFVFSLKGGEIGAGTGPLDLVLEKASGLRNLLYRMAEYVGELPLRVRGAPPKELLQSFQVRTAQPSIGSYRLEMKLTEPDQMELFASSGIEPRAVTEKLFGFLEALSTGSREMVERSVPDTKYRRALLELARNVAPRGKRLGEIALYRSAGERTQAVYLTNAIPTRVRQVLPPRTSEPFGKPEKLVGTLRALHLDESWLELTLSNGKHEKCDTLPEMLDDVVGPMVNHEVVVEGFRRKKQGGVVRLLVREIELAETS